MAFPAFVAPGAKPAGAAPDPRTGAPPSKAAAGDPGPPDAPATRDKDALRAAVGASPGGSGERAAPGDDTEDDAAGHDDEPRQSRSSRAILLATVLALGTAGAAALALFGYLNSDRYVLACEPERAVPEEGRGFPPWGTRALAGAPWRPLKIAPETRCRSQETDDPLVLQRVFLAMVLDQATALLTAREVTRVDDAEALLQQALLLTRPAEREPESLARQRGEQHQEIERLLGDVAYWRGQAKLRDALGVLGDAAKQFDTAVARHPRHASDAAAWAARVRTLAEELHAGAAGPAGGPVPPASPAPPASPGEPSPAPGPPSPAPAATTGSAGHPGVPAGIAIPVETDRAARPPAPAAPPSDAGPPTGGVLL